MYVMKNRIEMCLKPAISMKTIIDKFMAGFLIATNGEDVVLVVLGGYSADFGILCTVTISYLYQNLKCIFLHLTAENTCKIQK